MQSYEHRPWLLQSPPVSEPAVALLGRHVKKLRLGEAKGLVQGHGNPERCLLSPAGSRIVCRGKGLGE